MRKIGILTGHFLFWNGGLDFLKRLMMALNNVANREFEFIVFAQEEKTFYKYNGFKKYLKAFQEIYLNFHKFYLVNDANDIFDGMTNNFIFVKCPSLRELKKAIAHYGVDIVFPCDNYKLPPLSIPSVGYIPDCQHKYYPDYFSIKEIEYRDRSFSSLVKKNDHLMVNAGTVKNDLINFYGANPTNVTVLPSAPFIKEKFLLQDDLEIAKRYALPERFFMIANQFWLHKDHETAFKAFAEFHKSAKREKIETSLICTGSMEDYRDNDYIERLKKLIRDLGMTDRIRCLGFIPKEDQIAIMKKAIALVQPTLFEGGPGGGSVADALALGVRCIVSDIDTNRELHSDLVTFFKAGSENSLAEKMELILKMQNEPIDIKCQILQNKQNQTNLGRHLIEMLEEVIDVKSRNR